VNPSELKKNHGGEVEVELRLNEINGFWPSVVDN